LLRAGPCLFFPYRKLSPVAAKKMTLKKLAGVLHLWLGLGSGLVITIVALLGAIYAFQPELTEALQPYLHVQAEERPFLPLSALKQQGEAQLPGKAVTRISFAGRDHSVAVSFNDKKRGYYYIVYLNPYTGAVLKVKNMDRDFFRQVLNGHMHLWLPDPVGGTIVKYATLIFGLIIITGLLLWWPRKWTKAMRKQSFAIKTNASPKRLNYDLHSVLGFYASWFMLFTVLTGLVWTFDSIRDAEYWAFSGGKKFPAADKVKSVKPAQAIAGNPLDRIGEQVDARYPNAARIQYLVPAAPTGVITVRLYPEKKRTYNGDVLTFNQYTALELAGGARGKYADANNGEKVNKMNYDIHTGGIGGLPLRVAVFFAALITASLPITGFYIWWGKKKKKKAKPAVKPALVAIKSRQAELAK
jgi:uncharacterized iron-regulated membrane protein